ncbi:transposase [Streptomyces javensis]|uniref:transposase n=1 Tax=Streptomyces javensis TaxID=114698 RepID=UPI003F4D16A7
MRSTSWRRTVRARRWGAWDRHRPALGPRRLRLRLLSAAAQLVTTARRRHLRFARHWPWTDVITEAIQRLAALSNPG